MNLPLLYYSEFGQDEYLDNTIFQKKENGTFIEIGAGDGIHFSNTFFFEKDRNWKGLCIEPRISEFQNLFNNRTCICENCCISMIEQSEKFIEFSGGWLPMLSGIERNFSSEHKAKIKEGMSQPAHQHRMTVKEIPSYRLQTLLDKHNIVHIDYCSIDTEGSELEILQSIDFDKTVIHVFTIENNYGNPDISQFMKSKGYELIMEIGQPKIALDQLYQKKK